MTKHLKEKKHIDISECERDFNKLMALKSIFTACCGPLIGQTQNDLRVQWPNYRDLEYSCTPCIGGK